MVKVVKKKKSSSEIVKYFTEHHKLFSPPLESRIDLKVFSQKIYDNAIQFWAIDSCTQKNVGFMACYFNFPEKVYGYITTISVVESMQGLGLGEELVKKAIECGKERGFRSIRLEVNLQNIRAISFYRRLGFEKYDESDSSLFLRIDLEENVL